MLKAILRSAAAHTRRLIYIWLAVLVANQLFIFGACFAPHCLIAAVPHTLAIAFLLNFFGFRREEADKEGSPVSSIPSPKRGAPATSHAEPAINPAEWKRLAPSESRAGFVILCGLIALFIGLGLLSMKGSRSPTGGNTAEVESGVDASKDSTKPDERSSALAAFPAEGSDEEGTEGQVAQDGPQLYVAVRGEIPDEHLSLAERRAMRTTEADDSTALTLNEDGDDEYDVNDIEQYERLTGKKYRGSTHRIKYDVHIDDDEVGIKSANNVKGVAKNNDVTENTTGEAVSMDHAYQCVSSSGRAAAGTGHPAREGEYSAFLGKRVRAGEFVVFRYQDSTREYWFKSSHCQRL